MTLGSTIDLYDRWANDEDEILRCAQDDTRRQLRLMPSGRRAG